MVVTAEEMPWLVVTADELQGLVVTAEEVKGLVVTAEEMQRPIFKVQWLRGNWSHVCENPWDFIFVFCFSGTIMSDCQHEWHFFPPSLLIYSPLYSPHIIVSAIGRVNVVNDVLKEKTHSVNTQHPPLSAALLVYRSLPRVITLVSLGCCNWVHYYCLIYVVVFSLQQKGCNNKQTGLDATTAKRVLFSCNNWIFLSIFWLGLEEIEA